MISMLALKTEYTAKDYTQTKHKDLTFAFEALLSIFFFPMGDNSKESEIQFSVDSYENEMQ